MSVKSDKWIRKMSRFQGMIDPFAEAQIRSGISFGVSSYGYDFRIGKTFKVYAPNKDSVIDPKNFCETDYTLVEGDNILLPPHGYALAQTIEYFRIPRDIITICFGKSTYARCGVQVLVTPFEPEWEGYATISIVNTTPRAARIYAGEGIGQLLFLEADETCAVSYADKKGKYQASRAIVGAIGRG
ncbi:MAG: dCTP deaminase [Deltaproteobacteria bacterium]|nr:dCTP deaminase [Deltaproteobacteria bacterium]